MSGSASLTRTPRRELAPFVSEIKIVASSDAGVERSVEHLPDGKVSMLFRLTADGGDLSVSGPRRVARYKRVRALPLYAMVIFRPGGASPFLGAPLGLLADRIVALDDLWERTRLRASSTRCAPRPTATSSPAASRTRSSRACARRPAPTPRWRPSRAAPPASSPRARSLDRCDRRAVRRERAAPPADVRRRRRGEPERALADVAAPARARSARGARASWSEVAAAGGFFDQSHLIADARAAEDDPGVLPRASRDHADAVHRLLITGARGKPGNPSLDTHGEPEIAARQRPGPGSRLQRVIHPGLRLCLVTPVRKGRDEARSEGEQSGSQASLGVIPARRTARWNDPSTAVLSAMKSAPSPSAHRP